MAVGAQVNNLLERVTGRRLMRHCPPARAGDPVGSIEPDAQAILDQVADRTMSVRLQRYTTWSAVRYLVDNGLEGSIVECGTWRGGQAMIAALALLEAGDTSRDLYLFDTFEGMTAPTDADTRIDDGVTARQLLDDEAAGDRTAPNNTWCVADRADVWAGMSSTGYPTDRIHLVAGKVEDTIPSEAPPTIALLRLDTDWYESTRHELLHLWDRVVPYGIVVIDDYDVWAGSRLAADEFFAGLDRRPMLFRPGQGRALVKL